MSNPTNGNGNDIDDTEWSMRRLYEHHGYDPASLVHPRDVTGDMVVEGTEVVAYCVVRNPDPDAPATMYDLTTFAVGPDDAIPTEAMAEETDGAVSYADDTPVTHGVAYASSPRGPVVVSIGYGDEMYGSDSKFADPNAWDRLVGNVRANSDSFIRFDIPDDAVVEVAGR